MEKQEQEMADKYELLILGIGNILLGDEGFGVHVVRELEKYDLPSGVTVMDGGTGGEDLVFWIEDAERLIVVDAIDAGAEPGTLFRFRDGDLDLASVEHPLSLHDSSFVNVLQLARLRGCLPETTVFAVQVESIDWGLALTPRVQEAVPRVIKAIELELSAIMS
ncbi:MAG: HyaD/HybD family hydrogenase maturation endopeptidase [Bacillota bacterium]